VQPPVGTIAMLFTDVEGSTRLATELGSRWPDVLADHHRLISSAIDAEGGFVEGTGGDAFFATFADAAAAARAAITALRAVRDRPWPEEVGELKVRMGLHVGYVERNATGYVGLEVHRAARVGAAAHGGQLLLTASARDLVGDVIAVEPAGAHRLKDFPMPEVLFCAVVDGRGAAAFPPPRAHEVRPTNLPAGLPILIGRDDDLQQVRQLIAVDGERLVTLSGRGGSGKTSLALTAGADLLDEHPGGVWLARLATLTAAEQVLPAVAAAVGGDGDVGSSPLEAIVARLAHRGATLVILDNLEHLPGVASDIGSLLEALPNLRILATSQLPLRLEAEYALVLDALADGPALELMARVARRRAVTLPIDGPDRDALCEIVALLDGLPLALELAAARLSLMTPRALRDRLLGSFELLREDRSDRPERQRSLLGTVEWTLGLLDEPTRALFTRLGVFAGPVALEEIEAVVGGAGVDVLDALPALLDVALIRRVESGDGRMRFGLPEALRQMAVARLEASPDGGAWRRAHAQHVNDVVGAARTLQVPGAVYAAALAADPEASAALRWARAAGEPVADTLAASRALVLSEQGRRREALELTDSLGDITRLDPDSQALVLLSRLYAELRGAGSELGDRAVSVAVDPSVVCCALEMRGVARLFVGESEAALADHVRATAMARDLDPATLTGALVLEAQARLYTGDPQAAQRLLAEAERVGRPVDANFLWKRHTLFGDLEMLEGRPEGALPHYVASFEAAQARGNELQILYDLTGTAIALAAAGRDEDALEMIGTAEMQAAELGGPGADALEHLLSDDALGAAERRLGASAAERCRARGRSVPAAMRVTRACELARPSEVPA
jgi:predicted ATPase/class 3 adenylate cyclase